MIAIDYTFLKTILLPTELRGKVIRDAWLAVLDRDIRTLYDEFLVARQLDLFDKNHTAQIMSLEHYINTKLVLELTQPVYITDGQYTPKTYLYLKSEVNKLLDVYLYNQSETAVDTYLFNIVEYTGTDYDFAVYVRLVDSALEDTIKSYIDSYNIAGKIYKIIYY